MHKELQRIRHGYYDLWFGTNAVYERWAKSYLCLYRMRAVRTSACSVIKKLSAVSRLRRRET